MITVNPTTNTPEDKSPFERVCTRCLRTHSIKYRNDTGLCTDCEPAAGTDADGSAAAGAQGRAGCTPQTARKHIGLYAMATEGLSFQAAAAIEQAKLGAQGVNVDDELQQLMMIEKGYAANSRVVSTLSTMLDTLLNAV